MDKRKAILSIFVIMIGFLVVGILNVVMGKPSLLTAKINRLKVQNITEVQTQKPGDKNKDDDERYNSIPLERILVPGANGDEVKRVQIFLKDKDYYQGEINGTFDESLKGSIKEFQGENGIRQSGFISLSTIEKITGQLFDNPYRDVRFSRTIYVGNKGKDVEKVQYLLIKSGYYSGEINGILDGDTKKAIMTLQQDFGIPQTGNAGNQTQKVLLDME